MTATPASALAVKRARALAVIRTAVAEVDPRLVRTIDDAEAAAAAAERTIVVVVGEVKQGKSSLVNSLLGRPGLSPVDVTVTTATYLVFADGEPGATVHFADGTPPLDTAPDQVATWATADAERPVRNIDVTVDAPWLRDVVLVDTPGAGGLVAAHADAALLAASRGSALLFVTDALAPLSRVELDFLSRAAEHVETVVFAITKIGLQRTWADVLAENRANLAASAPRFADARWIAVDSGLATSALDDLDGVHPTNVTDPADDLVITDALEDWEESGVAELLTLLRDELGPVQTLADTNVVRAARTTADRALRRLRLELADIEPDPELEAAVSEHRDRLVALKDETRTWGPRLERNLGLLRIDTGRELSTRILARRDAWSERLRTVRKAPSDAEVAGLFDELHADLDQVGTEMLSLLRARYRAVADQLFEEIADPEIVTEALRRLGTSAPLPAPARMPTDRPPGARDAMDSYFGLMMGNAIGGGLTGALGFIGLSIPGIGLAAGVAGVAARVWMNRDAGRQGDLRGAITSWISMAEGEIRAEIDRTATDARFLLSDSFRSSLDAAIEEAQTFLDAASEARNRDTQARAAQQRAVEKRVKALESAGSALDEVLRSNSTGRGTPAVIEG